jgi:hypothetical protein
MGHRGPPLNSQRDPKKLGQQDSKIPQIVTKTRELLVKRRGWGRGDGGGGSDDDDGGGRRLTGGGGGSHG